MTFTNDEIELVEKVKEKAIAEGFASSRVMNGFGRWLSWCEEHGEKPLPVTVEPLVRFLLDQTAKGTQLAEVQGLNEAICFAHGKAGVGPLRIVIEEGAWRAFNRALTTSAQIADTHRHYVVAPKDADLARAALERADAQR